MSQDKCILQSNMMDMHIYKNQEVSFGVVCYTHRRDSLENGKIIITSKEKP